VPAAITDEMLMMSRPGLISGLLPAAMDVSAKIEPDTEPRTLTGSGFIIDPAGYIVTNFHVIAGAYRIVVMFSNGETAPAKVAGYVRAGDIALLKVTTN